MSLSAGAFAELRRIFEEVFALPAARFHRGILHGDLPKWDSIGHMAMVAALEATYGVEFDVDEIMEMQSVAAILDLLARRGFPEGAPAA